MKTREATSLPSAGYHAVGKAVTREKLGKGDCRIEARGHPGPKAQAKGMWRNERQGESWPAAHEAGTGSAKEGSPVLILELAVPLHPSPAVGEEPGLGPGAFGIPAVSVPGLSGCQGLSEGG